MVMIYDKRTRSKLKMDGIDKEDLQLVAEFKDRFLEAMKLRSTDAEIEKGLKDLPESERTGRPAKYIIDFDLGSTKGKVEYRMPPGSCRSQEMGLDN